MQTGIVRAADGLLLPGVGPLAMFQWCGRLTGAPMTICEPWLFRGWRNNEHADGVDQSCITVAVTKGAAQSKRWEADEVELVLDDGN